MQITNLALNDYRSYRELVTEFPGGPIVLKGRNGRGKTNLVEAIAYLSTFSSHRVSADRALVRQAFDGSAGPGGAVIRVRADNGLRSRLLELEIVQGKANRARLNRAKVATRELLGEIRTVMFAPEDLQLVRGEPSGRRRFLDDILLQLKPSYVTVTRQLERVLRQRGAALKQLGRHIDPYDPHVDDVLDSWDQALAQLSAEIATHRASLVETLTPALRHHYAVVSEEDKDVDLTYLSDLQNQENERAGEIVSSWPQVPPVAEGYVPELAEVILEMQERYLQMIRHQRANELRRGVNLVGAHRDDFHLELHQMPVKGYASQGETWSAVLALRLAQKDALTADGSTPILILDDVFAELDERRRQALADSLSEVDQLFITTAVGSDVPDSLEATTYEIKWDSDSGSQLSRLGGEDAE